jgi:hypothetical protein
MTRDFNAAPGTAFPTSLDSDIGFLVINIYDLDIRKLCEEGLLDFAVCAASDLSGSCHPNHRGEGEDRPVTQDAGSGIQFLYSGREEHYVLISSLLFYLSPYRTDISYRNLSIQGRRAATISGISW